MKESKAWLISILITLVLIASFSGLIIDIVKPIAPKIIILIVGNAIIGVFFMTGVAKVLITPEPKK